MKYTHNPGKRCQFFKHLRVGKISNEEGFDVNHISLDIK